MKTRLSVYFVLAGVLSILLAACGGGGGGGVAFLPANTVTMTADKSKALANGMEEVTMTASVRDFYGNPLAGTGISFVISGGSGSLVSADLVTSASGTASAKVTRAAVPAPATNEVVTVTASAASSSGAASVKFINLPTSATVKVGFTKAVSDIATLTFDLVSTPAQTALPNVTAIGAADTPPFIGSLVVGQNTFAALLAPPDTYSLLTTLSPGLAVAANGQFMQFDFVIDPAITALPTFAVGPNNITAFHPLPGAAAFSPALVQTDFYSTTTFDTE